MWLLKCSADCLCLCHIVNIVHVFEEHLFLFVCAILTVGYVYVYVCFYILFVMCFLYLAQLLGDKLLAEWNCLLSL